LKSSSVSTNKDDLLRTRFDYGHSVIVEAGALANGYFKQFSSLTIKNKGVHDLVSEADVNTELFIKESFAKRFPDDAFFGEETGPSALESSRGVWVVDPIDGTQPFLSGLPNWCISIAYVLDGVLEFGLIFNPPMNELFVGGKIFPATVNGELIAPNPGKDFSAGLISVGFSPRSPHEFLFSAFRKLLDQNGMFYRNGSGALSLVYVASGRLLGHVEPHMHSWDCLAAIAIIEAAGGKVNDFLVGDALLKGNRVVAGTSATFAQLETLLDF
jgi:myo-inositol-1(or 4)-monophosphatase